MQELENASPQLKSKLSLARRLGTSLDISAEPTAFDTHATDVHRLDEDDWQQRFDKVQGR